MHTRLLTATLSALCCGAMLSCDSKTSGSADQSDAPKSAPTSSSAGATQLATLEGFKQDLSRLQSWYQQEQQQLRQQIPTQQQLTSLRQSLLERARQIPTQGLPAELQSAWHGLVEASSQLDSLLQSFPKPDANSPQLLQQAASALQPKWKALHHQSAEMAKQVSRVGQPYGIPDLSWIIPAPTP